MTIAEIRTMEEARQEVEQLNVVHLIKEGDWYRAHDWSAWLLSAFPMGEAVNKPLKVTAKKLKDGYVDCFVGFPCTSMGKFLQGTEDSFQPIDNDRLDVKVELLPEIGEVSFDNLNKQKEEWKNSQPLSTKKSNREEREVTEQAPRVVRLTDILARLVSLSMEDLSPREAYDILRELRRQAAAMF